MLTAINNEKIVIARDAQKPGIFTCPECGEVVILKQGKIVTPHFAHKPPVSCQYGSGESPLHHQVKTELYDALVDHAGAYEVELEKSFGPARPDVSARIDGKLVAFEVQRSTIHFDELQRRTEEYFLRGLSVVWILLPRELLSDGRISPKKWEIWTHASQLGEAYYWAGEGYVTPVKFRPFMIDVPATDWGGGYSYPSKRYRTPVVGHKAHLVEDFTHEVAKAWSSGIYDLPKRRVWRRIQK
ncbi:competence protein CoiA [Salmonella enterica]|nr:competence protein CoiA [Salmonella enterica]